MNNDTAKDLVQGFFTEIFLGNELLNTVDPSRGKFRNLLMTALDNYVATYYRKKGIKLEKSNILAESDEYIAPIKKSPGDIFIEKWAVKILDQVLLDLKDSCFQDGLSTHWNIFNSRVLQPIREDTKPPGLAEICTEFNVSEEAKASAMIITVKRRFRKTLERHIRVYANSDIEVEEEINELIEILSNIRA